MYCQLSMSAAPNQQAVKLVESLDNMLTCIPCHVQMVQRHLQKGVAAHAWVSETMTCYREHCCATSTLLNGVR